MVYLAFDFGTMSWGVAVGDQITATVTAVEAVSAIKGKPEWSVVDGLVKKWQPNAFVIGYPLKASGERFLLTDKVDVAIQRLEDRYSLTVYKADERLSTVHAKENLFEEKGFKGLEKGKIDSESAKIILENWFESVEAV